uniref:Peroxidase n=1 Tax=Populus alba TaxID=43335 RepID=A0A4U5PPM4_POPAL|nr:class III peroxidase [Populus alba]
MGGSGIIGKGKTVQNYDHVAAIEQLARSIQSKPTHNFSFTERSKQDKEMSSSVDEMKGLDDGGPFWRVPTGRRDGLISKSSEVISNIPPPFGNFTTLQTLFSNQGLDLKDLVSLSGMSHLNIFITCSYNWHCSLLIAHCSLFSNRLYNFTGTGDQDPALDSVYAANLKANKCKNINDNTTKVEMDPGSRNTFDLSYYTLALKRRGLFESDAFLTTNSDALSMINQLLQGSLDFYPECAKSMEKMGMINVKTGSNGEIRKRCAFVNIARAKYHGILVVIALCS